MIRGVPYDHQLEYLESTGSQYIDTGVVPNTNTKVQFKVMNTVSTGDCILGYSNRNDNADWRLFNYNQYLYFDRFYGRLDGSTKSPKVQFLSNEWREFEVGNFYVKDLATGSTLMSGSSSSFTGIDTIYLSHGSNSNSANKWGYVKIYDGNTLVQHLIPVSVNGVAKMYDRLTGTFPKHYGTFVAGPVASTPLMGVHLYQDHYTSYDYVQDSAFIMLDGIENVGRGKHGNEFSGWHELTKGLAVFQRPWNSVWTEDGLRQDGVNSDYIGTNPGLYQSFIQNIDTSYPEMVTARSNMVMTAEFVFEITGFTEAQRTNSSRTFRCGSAPR